MNFVLKDVTIQLHKYNSKNIKLLVFFLKANQYKIIFATLLEQRELR